MRSFRFLLSRRWALFALAIVGVAYATWWLGGWQFDRLEDRKDRNAVVRANEDGAPTPVEDVLRTGTGVSEDDEWRRVTATGTYAVEDTVIVRYRTRDGIAGIDVVVPLVTSSGTAVLVDRGWLQTDNEGASPDDVPAPPAGEVTIDGWLRSDGTGSSTRVADQSTRAVNSTAIGEALDREVYGGFVDLESEDPAPATSLQPVELPELDNGPHFFYGLQWWFFGVLAVFGFFYLMYDEWRVARRGGGPRSTRAGNPRTGDTTTRSTKPKKVRQSNHPYVRARQEQEAREAAEAAYSERSNPPSTGSMTPVTKDATGESTNAATLPNSSGRP